MIKKQLKTVLTLIVVSCIGYQNQCSFGASAEEATNSVDIHSIGWRICAPFSLTTLADHKLEENWPFWIDTLCNSICSKGKSMKENQLLGKILLRDLAKNFAISVGLLPVSHPEVFEIKTSSTEEPSFVGCKNSQKTGTNPTLHPYADWSLRNLPFISKTHNIESEIREMGCLSYRYKSYDNPLFMYDIDASEKISRTGFCNVRLMEAALIRLKEDQLIQKYCLSSQAIQLIEGLIQVCREKL